MSSPVPTTPGRPRRPPPSPRGRDAERHSTEGRSSWAAGRGRVAELHGHERPGATPRGGDDGGTIRIVLEQAGAAGEPDFGAPVPNPTTVAAIEAAWRGEVVALRSPAEAIAGLDPHDRGSGEQGARRGRSVKRAAHFRRDFKRVKRGAHGRGSNALELHRMGAHAQLEP